MGSFKAATSRQDLYCPFLRVSNKEERAHRHIERYFAET